jgi:hypothetical protein
MKKRIIFFMMIAGVFFAIVFFEAIAAGLGTTYTYPGFIEANASVGLGQPDNKEGPVDSPSRATDEKSADIPAETCPNDDRITGINPNQEITVSHSCKKIANDLEVSIHLAPLEFLEQHEYFYSYFISDGTNIVKQLDMSELIHLYAKVVYPMTVLVEIFDVNDDIPWFVKTENIDCSYLCYGYLCLSGDLEGYCCDESCCPNQAHCKPCPNGHHKCCSNTTDTCQDTEGDGNICCPPGKVGCLAASGGGACCDPGREIDVQGNSESIANNDITPSTADGTDFGIVKVSGSPVTHTFTIENTGDTDLNLTNSGLDRVTVTGTAFSLDTDAHTPVASGGGSSAFIVVFSPDATGTFTGTVSIDNDDADENPYTFEIQGTGENPTAVDLVSFKTPTDTFQISEAVKFFGGMAVLFVLIRFRRLKFKSRE